MSSKTSLWAGCETGPHKHGTPVTKCPQRGTSHCHTQKLAQHLQLWGVGQSKGIWGLPASGDKEGNRILYSILKSMEFWPTTDTVNSRGDELWSSRRLGTDFLGVEVMEFFIWEILNPGRSSTFLISIHCIPQPVLGLRCNLQDCL